LASSSTLEPGTNTVGRGSRRPGSPSYEFILVDYAWADPGDSIQTGQKKSGATGQAVSKSGSLGLLATGATGLKAWRQQKAAAPQ
jgi:hypothetical protein